MTFALSWLADVLRAAGLSVIEEQGWQDRGLGNMGNVRGVLCHHTGGPANANGTPSLGLIIHGRADLRGPLSHLYLARDASFHVVAAGHCNHAGAGLWQGVTAGNSSFVGIEAENAGTGQDHWPEPQVEAYARGVAAILVHLGAPAIMCAGHKEYALPRGRKIDPSFDMDAFRTRVAAFMTTDGRAARAVLATAPPVTQTSPHHAMLKQGARGDDVRLLQTKLGVGQDGIFGPGTEAAVKAFQGAHGLTADGLVGPATWAALGG